MKTKYTSLLRPVWSIIGLFYGFLSICRSGKTGHLPSSLTNEKA